MLPAALSTKADALVLAEEGVDQPWVWPGEKSGITIGPGYDVGYVTHEEFAADWKAHLSVSDFKRLDAVVGLQGNAARKAAPSLKGIVISKEVGIAIFHEQDVPKYIALTARTFPRSELLPADAFGALFSISYNRGESLAGPRRSEMYAISTITATADLEHRLNDTLRSIAWQVRSMQRLWEPTSGLYARRPREATLIESCILPV